MANPQDNPEVEREANEYANELEIRLEQTRRERDVTTEYADGLETKLSAIREIMALDPQQHNHLSASSTSAIWKILDNNN